MVGFVVTGLLGLAVLGVVSKAVAWRKAYTAAKSTQFPVFLSPVHLTDIWWLMVYKSLVPFLNRLPRRWKNPWLPMAQVWDIWKVGYVPFQEVGSDTFVLATPQGSLLWTCDTEVCRQLEMQHPQSQNAVEMTKFFEVYGPTVGSVEGNEWKTHRKVIMSGFTPATNAAVWKETTQQMKGLIDRWSEQNNIVPVTKHWMSRLALHVISAVFFRKSLNWSEHAQGIEPVPPGHQMRYEQALFTIIARLGTLHVTPRALLGILPMNRVREAHIAFTDWTKYMQELLGDTVARVPEITAKKNKSILESIVLAGTTGSSQTGDRPLPEESILGNIFFTALAGHETTGNIMAFALNLLAVYPEYQTKIQGDLDRQLSERPQDEWSVEHEYQTFQKGWLGAVLKEVLRLYCPVQFIPRVIVSPINVVDSKGSTHSIPEKTLCLLNFSAAFRNPKTWPQRDISSARRSELHDSPAVDFDPSRWLESGDVTAAVSDKDGSAPTLFPFGQGPHSCPGRLFAQVEMTAALATILVDHKLELVIDERTRRNCGGDEKLAWEETRDQALRMLVDGVEMNLAIHLLKELPIRLVKRS